MAQLYHPDHLSSASYEAHEYFALINEAYDVLGNPEMKQKYDDSRNPDKCIISGSEGCIVYDHPMAESRWAGFGHNTNK